ncbi:fibronectin fibrinogen binding protein [Amylolactobacillus amylotrophicus DSM 20534]|uniref:Rqc2 homolog RqcH n=3 Tax=Amylolactobacillus TaxID=2767876 RepID=A0A0R1YUM8_9LACO|nr:MULTISPECIES: NFACT RNA binding domain-containing protein [Amylolactobacillus]APT19196.1 hypothetical protein LA20533_08025 [Amylolactobacillus amylophilus DSM 20533 = JCM 1125]KRK38529.1 fibronectin fibrinogen binding protein [Amylolactobacillus amylotrophicus DSM 20534]KRM42828.1 fibronectin fibrinogen binding protein [Amylolactobacillus amylophilus DSM 20533 = JCM 1125]GED79691.1 hypothetical protein LAM01_01640 [Amylolactobacillus amylophilus]
MSFDGLFIKKYLEELKPQLETGKLMKVYQPFDQDVILIFRQSRKRKQLLLSTNANSPRFYLTDTDIDNPPVAPTFAMVLRKYLEGAILKEISQVGNDRIVNFDFTNHDELGDEQTLTLSLELMGRHSNLILINRNDGKIVDLQKRINPDENRVRMLLPKARYELPPLNEQLDICTVTKTQFANFSDINSFIHSLGGLDRDNKFELQTRLEESFSYETIQNFVATILETTPTLGLNNRKRPVFFSYTPTTLSANGRVKYDTLNELVDNFYRTEATNAWVKERAQKVNTLVNNELKKLTKKLVKLEDQLTHAENSESYRIKGELLNTYLNQVKPGMTQIALPNYYDENHELEISLAAELSPQRNAQKYFTKYQKLRNSIKYVNEQIEFTKQNIAYFESVQTAVANAEPADIAAIVAELQNQGYLKKTARKERKQKITEKQLSTFRLSSGKIVLVGKNNYQNDWLTFKKSQKTDLWLHVKNIPGSHVLIQSADSPSEQDIQEAAEIAAYYSKARLSSHVQVDYVPVKRVKKPNGAKPGFVIYTGQNSIEVTPNEAEILAKQVK